MWSSIHTACSSSSSKGASCSRYLLTGDASSGKSSLAMNLAHDHAMATGGSVLYVCRRPADRDTGEQQQQQQRFPLFISREEGRACSGSWDARALGLVQIKYVSRRSDLIDVLSRIALYDPVPSCLVIDDLSLIIDPSSAERSSKGHPSSFCGSSAASLEVLMLLAYAIDDAAGHIEKVARAREGGAMGGAGGVRLLIVDDCSDPQRSRVAGRVVDASLRLQLWPQEACAALLLGERGEEEVIFRYRADGKALLWTCGNT